MKHLILLTSLLLASTAFAAGECKNLNQKAREACFAQRAEPRCGPAKGQQATPEQARCRIQLMQTYTQPGEALSGAEMAKECYAKAKTKRAKAECATLVQFKFGP